MVIVFSIFITELKKKVAPQEETGCEFILEWSTFVIKI
jgi:hypothetical protein